MSIHPLRDRLPSVRLSRSLRVLICATVLAGAGIVAAFHDSARTNFRWDTTPDRMSATMPMRATPPRGASATVIPATATPVVQSAYPGAGKLVICGGGKLPGTIRSEFCKLAGGPEARIVVIPTATSNADDPAYLAKLLADWKTCDIDSVQLLHTRSRQTADDPAFVRPLTEATGVWLTGGDQVFLTDTYLGTAVLAQLKSLLTRGGVIAGTSAGAAVMSGVMIAGGRTKADVGQGFDFIKGAVIDQHFLKRNRMDRLIGVLASHPNLVGLGIDEETALVFDVREHHLSVLGSSYVVACVPDSRQKSVHLQFLKSGDTLGLNELMKPVVDDAPLVGVKAEPSASLKVGSL